MRLVRVGFVFMGCYLYSSFTIRVSACTIRGFIRSRKRMDFNELSRVLERSDSTMTQLSNAEGANCIREEKRFCQ